MRFVLREQDRRWTWLLVWGDDVLARGASDYASEGQAKAAADAFSRGIAAAEKAMRGR